MIARASGTGSGEDGSGVAKVADRGLQKVDAAGWVRVRASEGVDLSIPRGEMVASLAR